MTDQSAAPETAPAENFTNSVGGTGAVAFTEQTASVDQPSEPTPASTVSTPSVAPEEPQPTPMPTDASAPVVVPTPSTDVVTSGVTPVPDAADPNLSTAPTEATPEDTAAADRAAKKAEERKGKIAYLENALKHLIAGIEQDTEGAAKVCVEELRALKSVADYKLHALKGKLGLL